MSRGASKDPTPDFGVSHLSKESSYHKSPEKKLKPDASTMMADINICQLCKIVFESKEDISTDSTWINCSGKSCNWWVHSRCVGKSTIFILFQFNKGLSVLVLHLLFFISLILQRITV